MGVLWDAEAQRGFDVVVGTRALGVSCAFGAFGVRGGRGAWNSSRPGQTCGLLGWISHWTSGKPLFERVSCGASPALGAPGDVSLAPGPGWLMEKLLVLNELGDLQLQAGKIKVKENHQSFPSGGKLPLCGIREERSSISLAL